MGKKFKFEIGRKVQLSASEEHGEVVGRAEYKNNENQYLVYYQAGDGRAVESWWNEHRLVGV